MKRTLLLVLWSVFFINPIFAQKQLTRSRQAGYYTYIYKLTDKETFEIAAKSEAVINDTFLHTTIDSFYNAGTKPYDKTIMSLRLQTAMNKTQDSFITAKKKIYSNEKLPYGNYLYVKAVKNKLSYRLVPVANVHLRFINNRKDFQFMLTDLKGNPLPDEDVKIGKSKTVKYDARAKLYVTKFGAKLPVITVKHGGINNYFTYTIEKNGSAYLRDYNRKYVKEMRISPVKPAKYLGYLVFNKPMYKPLDTVKFKAYLVTAKGKSIKNKRLKVDLYKDWKGPGITLTKLNPYREGGYSYSFVLVDSLQLKLDQDYPIVLKEQKKDAWKEIYRGNFRYEDYELKSTNFSVRTDKEEHRPGSPVTVFFRATDENELAVPDGRVEITVTTNDASNFQDQKVFVKDTLWNTSLVLDPVGETKLVLPDSIFPKADVNFSIKATFLNSNNESKTAYKSLRYRMRDQEIRSVFHKDSLQLSYLIKGKPAKQKAVVYAFSGTQGDKDSLLTELPGAVKINNNVRKYLVKTANGYQDSIFLNGLNPEVRVSAVQGKDSLRIVVNNEHRLSFWYTIFSGDKVFLKGYANHLDTLLKHTSAKTAYVRINYIWGGDEIYTETSAFFSPQALKVKLLAPDLVYPGQTVHMQLKVADFNNRPVAATDVTAYAYTSKFKNGRNVFLPDFGRKATAREQQPKIDEKALTLQGEMKLNWDRWSKELELDTIQYYRFVQAKELYAIREKNNDTTALVAPFVVKDGEIEPAQIVYIDEVPVFFSQAEQLQRYAFAVTPGKHTIGLRTTGYMVTLENYEFVKGKKTILSIAADVGNTKAKVNKTKAELTADEAVLLTKYMLKISDRFNENKTVITTSNGITLLNPPPAVRRDKDLLIGPFKENYLNFKSGAVNQTFIKEPGYTYTFLPGLLRQKSYGSKYGFNVSLNSTPEGGANTDYTQYPLIKTELDSIWKAYLNLRSYTTDLFNHQMVDEAISGKLVMKLDTVVSKKMPYVKNVIIYKYDEPDFLEIYPGNTGYFYPLEAGRYRIMYLFKDNRYFVKEAVSVKAYGTNYFEWKGMKIKPADRLSTGIDRWIKSVKSNNRYLGSFVAGDKINELLNAAYFKTSALINQMNGRVVDENDGSPLPGVLIKIKGLNYGVVTDAGGRFEIKVPVKGNLLISYIGYNSRVVKVHKGAIDDIKLEVNKSALDEVTVVGYGTQKKEMLSSAVSDSRTYNFASPAIPGLAVLNEISIRGAGSLSGGVQKPLMIVDGLPYSGDINSLDPNSIASINVLKEAEATAIYGASAAGGVILIKTKAGTMQSNAAGDLVAQQNSMRTHFSDYAIWQPELLTDEEGMAKFTVKFPDDITNWTTRLVAMNGRKQSGIAVTNIKSFKTLSANFVSPQFAVAGDSIKVIGKLMNYSNAEENVNRKFSYNDAELLNSAVRFKNAHIDTVAIVARESGSAEKADSLKFEYTLKQDNGYFDGEVRKIPLLRAGVTETKGYFDALIRDTTVSYQFDPKLGKVTLGAEASVFPVLLDEMEKIRRYEYLCNEQLASKLKALLLEKSVRKYLGQDFKEEKNIKALIKKLQNNKRPEGTWGWWENSDEELWISLHVAEALLQAQKQGYAVVLDKDKLYSYLVDKLANRKDIDQIYAVRLLRLLNEKYYLKDWITAIEKQRAGAERRSALINGRYSGGATIEQPLYEKLEIMQLRQQAGLLVDMKWLLGLKKETMFGNWYWGDESNRFWDNSIQNTLLAYQILKADGHYREELDRILRYFLEQRKDGQWRNTYESSLILETVLPELMVGGKKPGPASITLNNTETVTAFPFNKVIEPHALKIDKKGDAPIYFTAYQQFNNPKPEKVSKDFTVKTWFDQNRVEAKTLKAGTLTTLNVEVTVRADADYVMIEVPVPAGCSYENKLQNFFGVESHREYFKNKTAIFCTKLKQGKYNFSIQLMPRYSGNYILNPAKAEMMYFPVFYGREGMKRIPVK